MPLAANPRSSRPDGANRTAGPSLPADPDADDYYQLLGVPYTATGAEITRAYRVAMKRIHPDRQLPARRAAAEEQAKRLNRAYSTLAKPVPRQAYDRTIRAQTIQDQLMGRYVGGFRPAQATAPDPFAADLRRDPTPAQRRERRRADQGALVSVVVVFAGLLVALVTLLLLWAAARALLGAAL